MNLLKTLLLFLLTIIGCNQEKQKLKEVRTNDLGLTYGE